ncbi:MAG: class I SAM-dependent methyltransferase [Thiohalorhabdaceae bacterium]
MLRHTRARDRHSIAYHYDISNDFYGLFLDPRMAYTCAYYPEEETDLEQAQLAKFEHIARKLRLKPYQSLLDIGCGWGSFIVYACKNHGVTAHGVTLSQQQADYANDWIRREGLEDQALVEYRDYRELVGEAQYDRISAIGIVEHVGYRNLARYFTGIHRLLKDNGLFLNHGISRCREWRPNPGSDWISDKVFPEGEPPSLSTVITQLEDNAFEVQDVENLRAHYAKTCAEWLKRLQRNREECLRHVDEQTYRTWILYLAMSSIYFEEGQIFLYQVLATKRMASFAPVPLTREDIYA